jgi:sulfate adenylyltransferase subunit 2
LCTDDLPKKYHGELQISDPQSTLRDWILDQCPRCEFTLRLSMPGSSLRIGHLQALEAESIHIVREVAAEFSRPALLYSIGKDSSVMLRLAQKAFYPGKIPFPLLYIETTYKFLEMIAFRDRTCQELGVDLIVHTNHGAIESGANPFHLGTAKCCGLLKTRALLDALQANGIDGAIGGARREGGKIAGQGADIFFSRHCGTMGPEESAPRALEPLQRPHREGRRCEGFSTFELDGARRLAIYRTGNHSCCFLYFAKQREVLIRGDLLILVEHSMEVLPGEKPRSVMCRMRSLGCTYCTGAIRSIADTLPKIIEELKTFRRSERENRIIDHDQDGSMELKKREGYF